MKHCLLGGAIVLAIAGTVTAAPLTPAIDKVDINFGAAFTYTATGGANQADTLVASANDGNEATAVWPNWPSTAGVLPIWYKLPSGASVYGGDVRLNVNFSGHDETNSPLTVSLTGTGNSMEIPIDLQIIGYIAAAPDPNATNEVLWALDLDKVSLYGYGNRTSYVLEGEGTIVESKIPGVQDLKGQKGVMRGNIDFKDFAVAPALQGFPAGYDPMAAMSQVVGTGSFSGETGLLPEPATLGLLIFGGLFGLWSRRPRRA